MERSPAWRKSPASLSNVAARSISDAVQHFNRYQGPALFYTLVKPRFPFFGRCNFDAPLQKPLSALGRGAFHGYNRDEEPTWIPRWMALWIKIRRQREIRLTKHLLRHRSQRSFSWTVYPRCRRSFAPREHFQSRGSSRRLVFLIA